MRTTVVSLSEFKARAAQMLAEIKAAEHEIVLTQRGAATAVVQDRWQDEPAGAGVRRSQGAREHGRERLIP